MTLEMVAGPPGNSTWFLAPTSRGVSNSENSFLINQPLPEESLGIITDRAVVVLVHYTNSYCAHISMHIFDRSKLRLVPGFLLHAASLAKAHETVSPWRTKRVIFQETTELDFDKLQSVVR